MPRRWCSFFLALLLVGTSVDVALGQSDTLREEAREAYARHDHETVIDLLQLLQQVDQLQEDDYFLLGRAFQIQLQHDEAIDAFTEADLTDPRVLTALAQSLRQTGRFPEARRRYQTAYSKDPSPHLAVQLARLHLQEERAREAAAVLQEALEQDPENAQLLSHLGRAYQSADSLETAIRYFEEAHALSSHDVDTALRLSLLHLATDAPSQARRVIDEVLEHNPDVPALWQRKGQIALRQQSATEAIDAVEQAISLSDSTSALMRLLGIAHYQRQDYEAAHRPLERAFAADTTNEQLAFYLGVTKNYLGHPDESLHYLQLATELYGQATMADIYEQLADVYKQQEQHADAIRADRLALHLAPEKHAAVFHLATVYDTYYADPDPALHHYELFLERVEDELPEMQEYARWRIRVIRQQQFFSSGEAVDDDANR